MGLEANPSLYPYPSASCCPLQGVPSPLHLPHVVSDPPIGHHFQGVQGHLLGPRAILGESMAEPVGEQEVQDHCWHQEYMDERMKAGGKGRRSRWSADPWPGWG